MNILKDHGITSAHARAASIFAGKTIGDTNKSVAANKEVIREYEEELLGHVQRMAAMEEIEL